MRLAFNNNPQIIAGLSEWPDRSMVWWNRLPVDEAVLANRDGYFKKQGIDPARVAAGGIAHGTNVAVVGELDAGKYLMNTDALITNAPNLFLSITIADCLPVYFYDAAAKGVGLAHAGWRGLIGGLLESTVSEMQRSYNSKTEDLKIIIGPHICARHYEVDEDVAEQFAEQNIERRDGRPYLNLAGEAESRLRTLGVKQTSVSPICTYEDQKFFSARRDKVEPLQGMVAYIGM
ncbi:MAG: peptidoglycan editing factor PgeF [bacterium]|nr:peptidoglycan editing factor PgeF [bacterium]